MLRNEARLDELMAGQKAIVDQRLGLSTVPRVHKEGEPEIKPIGRKGWKQVQAGYEADKRREYWADYIKQNEAAAETAGNDVKVGATAEPSIQEEVDEIAAK